ncbi:hypothetical protein EXE43_16850, partial [Halorubrum sp. SS5]
MPDKLFPVSNREDDFYPDWLKQVRHRYHKKNRDVTPQRLPESATQAIHSAAESYPGTLTRIRPDRNEDGLEYATELISSLHEEGVTQHPLKKKAGMGTRPKKYSFEVVFTNGELRFYVGLPDTVEEREFRQQLSGLYPTSEIKPGDNYFTNVEPGHVASMARMEKKDYKYIPIRSFSQPGVLDHDPYRSLLSAIAGPDSHTAVVQFVFTPVSENWTDGLLPHEYSIDQAHESLTFGRVNTGIFHTTVEDPSEQDRTAANAVQQVEDDPAFYVNIRFAVFGPRPKAVEGHIKSISRALDTQYHNGDAHQRLWPLTYNDQSLLRKLTNLANREFVYNHGAYTVEELAALAHLPGEEIDLQKVDWTQRGVGSSPPPTAPRTDAPPSMEVQRDLSDLDAQDAAMDYLPNSGETDYAGVGPGDAGPLTKRLGALADRFGKNNETETIDAPESAKPAPTETDEDADADESDTAAARAKQIDVDSPEKQSAFNEVYNQFLEGELTRTQIHEQYNENVADNLIRKFRERRAKELGVDLETLEQSHEELFAPEETVDELDDDSDPTENPSETTPGADTGPAPEESWGTSSESSGDADTVSGDTPATDTDPNDSAVTGQADDPADEGTTDPLHGEYDSATIAGEEIDPVVDDSVTDGDTAADTDPPPGSDDSDSGSDSE